MTPPAADFAVESYEREAIASLEDARKLGNEANMAAAQYLATRALVYATLAVAMRP